MIQSILIANRGEIAVRIIRACRDLGIRSVAVYSEADKESLHVKMADQAVCIGPARSTDSYLNIRNIVTAASLTQCDAIHPGVGFLSENAEFARETEEAGLIFIGPPPATIAMLGDKVTARNTAEKAGLPLIPGSPGPVKDPQEAIKTAERIGYPVIVKAAAGGGGRGMRIVNSSRELPGILEIASREAESFFSDGTLYMEKYLPSPRHVELQILADAAGNVIHLGERDCSVQKNHQKLIEESPSTVVTPELREKMGKDAMHLFSQLDYRGAGTIEFLVCQGKHYFMEVNARVQVEHPVSELISGVDIIIQQIRIASGLPLAYSQKDIRLSGYALECRINAITPGKITRFCPPLGPGVRVDTHLCTDSFVSPFYDHLVAKVIVQAADRASGISLMLRALREFEIHGISTNIEEQKMLLQTKLFQSGKFGTDMYANIMKEYQAQG